MTNQKIRKKRGSCKMAKIDLSKYGITGATDIVYNPSYELLFEEETKAGLEGYEVGKETELGAVSVMTGIYTGRSPKDKYIVMDENSKDTVWWTSDEYANDNHPMTEETWATVKDIAKKELSNKRLFVVDAFCGANADTRMAVRFIVEVAWQAHFIKNMFIQPTEAELETFEPTFIVYNASKAKVENYKELGLNSETCVAFNITSREQVIINTWYGGEMKKGMFSMMNYYLPLDGIASMVEQASQAAAEGGKEIVLTGVNIGDFGKSTGETFFDLVKALDEVEGIERYRISSIEPNLLTDEIIEYVSRSRRFMPHFHIPLQSGSDEVLKLMRRRYDTALFASKIKKIKEVMPDSFIGVDVIVGTRGETEEYFGQAYEFIKSLDVTQLHVFSYSERPGTQALKIDHVVAPEEKHRRSQQLLELSDEKTRAFYARHIGQTMPVLLERPKPGLPMHGFTPNYIRVEVPHDAALDNQLVSVRLGDFNADGTALLGAME